MSKEIIDDSNSVIQGKQGFLEVCINDLTDEQYL
jgi:hypothetical protein